MLATMAEQFRIDAAQLNAQDIGWLAGKVHKWYGRSECHLGIILDQLFVFKAIPAYTVGKVAGGGDPRAVLERAQAAAQAAFDAFCNLRTESWDARADGVPDIYEHAIQALEKIVAKCEQQLALVDGLGLSGYIGSRLEDE